MKKSILLITALIVLINVSLVLGAFSIPDTSVELMASAPGSATGTILMSNTGSSAINVSFSGTTMTCLDDGSETLAVSIASPYPVPANSNRTVPFSITVPNGKLACRYLAQLVATPTSGSPDGINIYLNVTPRPSLDVQNKNETLVKNLSDSKIMNVAVINRGNTDLSLAYTYTNFSKSGKALVSGASGVLMVPHGQTQYIQIYLFASDLFTDGVYTSALTITGDVNRTDSLSVNVKSPVLDITLPDFSMPDGERNKTITKKFNITNIGDYELYNVGLSTDADSEYDVRFSDVESYLMPGEKMEVNVTLTIPDDEETSSHSIGTVYFTSDRIEKSSDLKLNVISKLQISYVDVQINGESNKMKEDGATVDDEKNYPGSTFDVTMEICNKYADKDDEITDITVDATFVEVDDEDDIDGSVDGFDLEGDDKCIKKTISFDKNRISPLTDEGTYDLEIHVEGDDPDDRTQELDWTIPVRIYRDSDPNIVFDEVSVVPSQVSCDRALTIKASAYSVGEKNKEAALKITNPTLGINIEKLFKIGEDTSDDCDAIDYPDDSCIGFSKSFTVTLPDVLTTGDYPVLFELFVDKDKRTDDQTAMLKVAACSGTAAVTTGTTGGSTTGTTTGGTTATNTGVSGVPAGGGSAGGVIVTPSAASTGTSSGTTSGTPIRVRPVTDNSALVTVAIIAGILVAVIVIISIVVLLLRKPETF